MDAKVVTSAESLVASPIDHHQHRTLNPTDDTQKVAQHDKPSNCKQQESRSPRCAMQSLLTQKFLKLKEAISRNLTLVSTASGFYLLRKSKHRKSE